MTTQQKLQKLIEAAIDGGWKQMHIGKYAGMTHDLISGELVTVWEHKGLETKWSVMSKWSVMAVIFNHEFNKALWGEGERPPCLCDYEDWMCEEIQHNTNAWQYHLQRAVINENPIDYMYDNLPEDKK